MTVTAKVTLPTTIGALGSSGTITINTAGLNGPSGPWSNAVLTSSGSGYTYSTMASTGYTAYSQSTPSLHVTGTAEFDHDIKIKGVSISETLEKINQRLAILQPDPKKLAHFEALKKAYEHYKMLELMCQLPEDKDE
mgnify:CR=1 FL=1